MATPLRAALAAVKSCASEAGMHEKGENPRAAAVPDKPREQRAEEAATDGAPETRAVDGPQAVDECCMCLEASKQFMFAPCGHRCVCETCAEDDQGVSHMPRCGQLHFQSFLVIGVAWSTFRVENKFCI